jgi:2-C-methyl-D-erythritol 2,4-cyclodiphosphate synthase
MENRIGIGYDIHRLSEGRKLFLGGVEIPYEKGLLGHSDADVLLHAVCDAMLGAASLGDIGQHFPSADPAYKDASSADLLRKVESLVKQKGFTIDNIDTVIIAEKPNLSTLKKKIATQIAVLLGIDITKVEVKAKTNEGLGEIGRGEAIAAYAVASLKKGAL